LQFALPLAARFSLRILTRYGQATSVADQPETPQE
jgi:hypothetical protein